MTAMKFEDQKLPDLNDYARLAEQFIPGRRAIFAIVEASLLELLPEGPARILVVGAGGGEEILRLGLDNPHWSFVGVDTYQPMVELARRRLAESPVGARAQVHAMPIDDLDDREFDAATCILTAHFVPDDGAKLAFFKAIRARLKRGAPLAVVDGVGVAGEPQTELLRRIWKRHAIRNGVAEDVAEANAQNFAKVAVVSAERQEDLLTTAGFERLTPIFRGLAIKGWLAFAESQLTRPSTSNSKRNPS
jgi:tRNA (cmo5U34)-methyltransferase